MGMIDEKAALTLVLQEIRDATDSTEHFGVDSNQRGSEGFEKRNQFLRDQVLGRNQATYTQIGLSEAFKDLEITDEFVLAELEKAIEEVA